MVRPGGTAVVQRGPSGVRILTEVAHRRELTTALWTAGCEILTITVVRPSLQEAFLAGAARREASP